MRVSQLLYVMDRDEPIVISDYDAPVDKALLYEGSVRGVKKDNPINRMRVLSVCADDDTVLVLVTKQKMKGGVEE